MSDVPTLNEHDTTALDALMREHFGPAIDDASETEPLWTAPSELTQGVSPSLRGGGMLQFDSLDKVEFMMAVEDEFDVTLPDVIASLITNKAELRTHLATLRATRRASKR